MTAPRLTLSRREHQGYSLAGAILALAAPRLDRSSALAFDVDQQLRADWPEMAARDERALLVPYEGLVGERAGIGLSTSVSGAGQELKFQTGQPWLDLLRVQSVVLQCGATLIPGLKGDAPFPRIVTAETVYNVAQNPGSDTTQADITFGQFTLTPHELQATTSYSRQLLAQSAVVPGNRIDLILARSLARQHGVQIDIDAIGGTGSGNQPTGVATQLTGSQLIAFGTNGAQPTWANLCAIEGAVANANAAEPQYTPSGDDDRPPTSFLVCSPTMRQRLREQDRGGSTTTGRFLLESDRLFDTYPVVVSNAVPQALTKGSSSTCQAIVFGVWQDLYVGLWGPGLEIVVDPFRLKKQGMIEVTSFQLHDIGVAHTGSFAGSLDALP